MGNFIRIVQINGNYRMQIGMSEADLGYTELPRDAEVIKTFYRVDSEFGDYLRKKVIPNLKGLNHEEVKSVLERILQNKTKINYLNEDDYKD